MQKISFTTLSTPGHDVLSVAKMASRCGYDGVDLRVSARAGEILPDAADGAIKAVRDILEGEGVEAAGLMSYIAFDEELPPKEMTASLRRQLERQLDIAELLGAQAVRIGGAKAGERSFANELGEALSAVLGRAGEIDFVIQNHEGAFSAGECLALVRELNHPRFTLAFSPDHCVVTNESVNDVFPALKGRARKLFVSDLKYIDGKYMSVLPGQGVVPFLDSYAALGGEGFDGWITLKYEKFWEPTLEGPEVSLPYFMDRAPAWFAGWRK